MKINEIILEILKKGFVLEMSINERNEISYSIDGFYKSGNVKLIEKDGILYAHARYNEVTEINCFRDLVFLNFMWWEGSKERFGGWSNPSTDWLPFLIEEKLVKIDITETVNYIKC